MQLQCHGAKIAAIRAFASPACCPVCGDWMVAPVVSEFVVGGEIRHHWECDSCGEPFSTAIPLCEDEALAE
jgi:hypothetical protein